MPELVFEVVQEADGDYCAECLAENIFTEGNRWDELRKNVIEAASAFYQIAEGRLAAAESALSLALAGLANGLGEPCTGMPPL
jgi:hypothetical protein